MVTGQMRQEKATTNRRNAIKSIAAFTAGATLFAPAVAKASIFGQFAQQRVLRDTDREANSIFAMRAIGTTDPIISLDTEYNLQRVAEYYERLVNIGGWPEVPTGVFGLVLGNSRSAVRDLRRYLMHTGDLSQEAEMSELFDADVDVAVRGFQARHGLQISGKVDEYTYWAMTVPASTRLHQINLNLQRVRGLEGRLTDRYVNVNIPAAAIEAVESRQVVQRHTAVVGRIDRQTPILQSRIHEINFNPYWTAPTSIVRRDIIPMVRDNPNYLNEYGIRILDGRGNQISQDSIDWNTEEAANYTFRQDPGENNAMGHAKINFHNPHTVYLHDTPQRGFFSENARFHSSGCVRVADVDSFIAWVLRDNGYDLGAVTEAFVSRERRDVAVNSPVPIFTTYFTAWANRNGVVSFRDDVYDFDSEGRTEFPEIS